MEKCCKVSGGVGCTGILDEIDFPLCTFCQPDKPPCLSFLAVVGASPVVVASFARPREVQNSSLAAGYIVAAVDSVGFVY